MHDNPPNPRAVNARYARGLRHLQQAYADGVQDRINSLDSLPELAAMESLCAALYARACEGDTAQWRAQLAAECGPDTPEALADLIRAGVAEDELYDSCFAKLAVLAKTRHEAMAEQTKRQNVITGAQFLELLTLWFADLRSELGDPVLYGRVAARLLARTPEIGAEEAVHGTH